MTGTGTEQLRMIEQNKIFITGRAIKDVELRHTSNKQPVVTFTIASNRKYKDNQTGEWKDSATFVPIVAFGGWAEASAERLKKGNVVAIEGRLRSGSWETKTGEKRYTLDVMVERMQFLNKITSNTAKNMVNTNTNTDIKSEEVRNEEEIPF